MRDARSMEGPRPEVQTGRNNNDPFESLDALRSQARIAVSGDVISCAERCSTRKSFCVCVMSHTSQCLFSAFT